MTLWRRGTELSKGTMQKERENLFGLGLFSVPEAARLTGVRPERIRRWLAGYTYHTHGRVVRQEPLWKPEVPEIDGELMLSFNDLVEVMHVQWYVQAQIPLQRVRVALRELQRKLGTPYPLSREEIVTDGRVIFQELTVDGRPVLYELTGSRQYAMYEAFLRELRKALIFDEQRRAAKWYPDRKSAKLIVVDPRIMFGRPVVDGTRIPAMVLARAFSAENSYERVAEWYEIDPVAVRQAVAFEQRYAV